MESNVFSLLPDNTSRYSLTKEKWLAMRGLAEDPNIVIKPADKDSCVVVWDKTDYLLEAEKHLSDSNTYKEVKLGDLNEFKCSSKRSLTRFLKYSLLVHFSNFFRFVFVIFLIL